MVLHIRQEPSCENQMPQLYQVSNYHDYAGDSVAERRFIMANGTMELHMMMLREAKKENPNAEFKDLSAGGIKLFTCGRSPRQGHNDSHLYTIMEVEIEHTPEVRSQMEAHI